MSSMHLSLIVPVGSVWCVVGTTVDFAATAWWADTFT